MASFPLSFSTSDVFVPAKASQSFLRCQICGCAVPLESANTDENGQAVHERCYLGRLTSTEAA